MREENTKMPLWLAIVLAILGSGGALVSIYKLGVNHSEARCNNKEVDWKMERRDLEDSIKILNKTIEVLEVSEKARKKNVTAAGITGKQNNTNDVNSVFKIQIEVLIKQGNDLLQNYDTQTNMASKFNSWKGNVIGILKNRDENIAVRFDEIEKKYSSSDYYSQIKEVINILSNHLN